MANTNTKYFTLIEMYKVYILIDILKEIFLF